MALHKIVSFSMALLVLFSTVSFTVEKHYCGDVLVDVSVFTEVDKCASEAEEIIAKMDCCKDTIDVIQGQDELSVKTFKDLDFEQQVFLASFTYSYINLFEGLPKEDVPFKDYSPPNLVADIQVLNQVFII